MTPRERVIAALPDGVDGVFLESAEAVSWYLGGARTSVPLGGPSVVTVLVRRDGDELRCHVMEAERLRDEEGVGDVVEVDWAQPLIPDHWRRDPGVRSEHQLEGALRAARASLSEAETARYRGLGAEVAESVTVVASGARPERSEREVAGQLADALYSIGAEPVVLLVAGSNRLGYRHPLPTAAALGERAMIVVGARRQGLVVNLTRWVGFDAVEPVANGRLRAVEADVLDATVPGAAFADVFRALVASYAANGFDPLEWRRHHQGGPTGYFGRDPKVTPTTSGAVAERQAFAWNPSAPGGKTEDTVIATSTGIELLTHDPSWPSVIVNGRPRPLTLQL